MDVASGSLAGFLATVGATAAGKWSWSLEQSPRLHQYYAHNKLRRPIFVLVRARSEQPTSGTRQGLYGRKSFGVSTHLELSECRLLYNREPHVSTFPVCLRNWV